MMSEMPNLKAKYREEVAPALMQKFNYKSTMQIPRIEKIVVNVGCGEARDNAKVLDAVVRDLGVITGQKAIVTNEQGIRVVDTDKCIGCGACVEACPWHMPTVNPETGKSSKCIACGACVAGCPSGALSIVDWDAVTSAAQAAYKDL